jgi:hypothetical protein
VRAEDQIIVHMLAVEAVNHITHTDRQHDQYSQAEYGQQRLYPVP